MNDGMEIVAADKNEMALSPNTETGALLQMAVDKDLDVDKLKELISLYNQQKAQQCKDLFEERFSEMQKEFTPIVRSKKGDKGRYAPVDDLVKKYGPIISKYGFSYYWDEDQLDDGSIKTTLYISGYGYTKSNSKVLPKYEPDKASSTGKPIMNAMQAEGVRSTYNYRYTFKAGFGITETDEDTDGCLTFDDGVFYSDYVGMINSCETMEELKVEWSAIWKQLDSQGKQIMTTVYNKKKQELQK